MRGGNAGARVIGTATSRGLPVEVYHDQIYLEVDHDTGVVPTALVPVTSGNVHIGSLGYGDYCEVHLVGANSADVGVEIDGMQTALVYGRVTDARNAAFFARNFHAPPHTSTQSIRFVRCKSRLIRLNPDGRTYSAHGFVIGEATPPNPTFNSAILEDCYFYSAARNFAAIGQALYVPPGAMVSRVSILGKLNIVCDAIDDQPTTPVFPALLGVFPSQSRFTLDIPGRVQARIAGTGGAELMPHLVWISPQAGCRLRLAINGLRLSSTLARTAAGTTHGLVLGGGPRGAGSIRGYIRDLGWGSFSGGDTDPSLLYVYPSMLVSLGKVVVDQLDLRNSPSATPALVRGANTAQKAMLDIRHVILPLKSTNGGS